MQNINIIVNGVCLQVPAGITAAAAMLNNDISHFRDSVKGHKRAPLCGMGICYECRATINGNAHQRTCMTLCSE